jgi:16S rRNA (cytidine1402-2'-O)-methyltransferase
MGCLYLIATPIGNLQDITLRALDTLKQVDLIAAEDTRQTGILLQHFDIHTRLTSYHEHNKETKTTSLVDYLESHDLAIVSDAGTPALNDPGYEIVKEALDRGYRVIPVPGACAPITAITASGLPTDQFLYIGYLPRKHTERIKLLHELEDLPYTLVLLETPHRLVDALVDLRQALGDRKIVLGREMTKKFEEFIHLTLNNADEYFLTHEPRGEFTVVIEGKKRSSNDQWSQEAIEKEIQRRMGEPYQARELAKEISLASGWNSKDIYDVIHMVRKKGKE